MYKCKHFMIRELVSPKVYEKFGDFAWSFFDEDIVKDLDFVRGQWGSGIIINDYAFGGQYKESGLRCNVDSIVVTKVVPYLSGHVLAKGFDLKPKNKDIEGFYNFLWDLMKTGKLKKFRRLENIKYTPSWVHIDALQTMNNLPEIFSI